MLESERRDHLSQPHLVADGVLQCGIIPLDDAHDLVAVHRLHHLTLVRLTEAGREHLPDVLLLHEVQVQLLDAGHLIVAVPIRSLQLQQLVHHLCIQLPVVNVARVVDHLPVWNLDADIATAARCVLQRMTVVGSGHKRGKAQPVLLGPSEDRTSVHLAHRERLL